MAQFINPSRIFPREPVTRQLGGSGSTVTSFNPETGMLDLVRGERHISLSADELATLLSHLYDLRDDIYAVRLNAFYKDYK